MTVYITESTGYDLLVEIVVIDLVGIKKIRVKTYSHIFEIFNEHAYEIQFLNHTYLNTSPILLENCVVISVAESRCRQLKQIS